jgi:nucleotide-binding universal stress UspA family protein
MFHEIVVPLDGSSLGECAIGPAGWIATECRARLHLIRVHVPRGDGAAQDAVARAADRRYVHELAGWIREGSNHETVDVVLDGSPALAIADYADRVNADLIVMTTHGRSGIERRQLGSVAGVVAHHVACPVILARGEPGEYVPRQVPLERIVLAADGTERSEEIQALALRLGRLGQPRFRVMCAVAPPLVAQAAVSRSFDEHDEREAVAAAERYVCDIAARLRAAGMRAETLVTVTDDSPRSILEAAARDAADAVVILGQRG